MTPREIADRIYDRICGTSEDIIAGIDIMIEDQEFSQEQFISNESEILALVDERMFNCQVCNWTVDINEMSCQEDMVCVDCEDDSQ